MQFTYRPCSHPEHWPYLALSVSKGTGAAPFRNLAPPPPTLHKGQVHGIEQLSIQNTSHGLGVASAKLQVSQISAEDRKLIQAFWQATLWSKAQPTEMMATPQHKPISAITSDEEQKSVQNLCSSPTSHTFILNTGHTSRSL